MRRLIEGRAALAGGRARDAIAILTAALAQDKPDPRHCASPSYYLGQAYRSDGQAAKGAEVFDALARTPAAPVATDAQYMLGQGHIEARRFAEAIPPLEKYLAEQARRRGRRLRPGPPGPGPPRARPGRRRRQGPGATGRPVPPAARPWRRPGSGWPRRRCRPSIPIARPSSSGSWPTETTRPWPSGPARAWAGPCSKGASRPRRRRRSPRCSAAAPDDPLSPDAALGRGRALELARKPEEALAAYDFVVKTYPKADQADLAALARARLLVETQPPGRRRAGVRAVPRGASRLQDAGRRRRARRRCSTSGAGP